MSEMNEHNQMIINEFRANEGKVGGPFEGSPVVLLTTTGAKTGQPRINPLVSLIDDDGTMYVIASAAGAPKHPAWFHNLVATPSVQVEYGTETFQANASVITGEKRDELYALQVERFASFAEYEEKTSRTIPVVVLNRA
jgi:deazaflavin-dependent oxidoreductase (nitroreductase family)